MNVKSFRKYNKKRTVSKLRTVNKSKVYHNEKCQKEQERLKKQARKSGRIEAIVFAIVYLFIETAVICGSVNWMRYQDFAVGLACLIVMSLFVVISAYYTIKVSIHGFSDY